jgi:sec-independent protein translocase protein TatA
MIFKRWGRPGAQIWVADAQGTGHVPLPGAGKKPYRMLSIPDMALLGAAALMFFGPDQLPKVAKKFGVFMRDVQNTSQQFIREMERAAEDPVPSSPDLATAHEFSEPASANGSSHEASSWNGSSWYDNGANGGYAYEPPTVDHGPKPLGWYEASP